MITDASLPMAFQVIRDKDEKVLWAGKPARAPFLVSGLPFLMIKKTFDEQPRAAA